MKLLINYLPYLALLACLSMIMVYYHNLFLIPIIIFIIGYLIYKNIKIALIVIIIILLLNYNFNRQLIAPVFSDNKFIINKVNKYDYYG
ncbi:MAG: hypothetical protein LBR40_06350, partial [Bacilli bacterium]|nr:hypothetical protein [Bacilli bacterium]